MLQTAVRSPLMVEWACEKPLIFLKLQTERNLLISMSGPAIICPLGPRYTKPELQAKKKPSTP